MGKLIYMAIASLDGYIEDTRGSFEWATPDEEMHLFVNSLARPVLTHLYGRKMYEIMSAWETLGIGDGISAEEREFADLWRSVDKVVYSTTLTDVTTARTRLERTFDAEAVHAMKAALPHDLSVSGPGLAAHAFRAGLVDEIHLFLQPITVGAGKAALPTDQSIPLGLIEQRTFASGALFLRYATRS